jgi:aryl-alcohol dehydrogenase-like predicted oxidoreductase
MTSLNSYLTLGRSGLRVSPLSLGTMTFGEDGGWGASPETSEAILAEYLDRGGNVIDTANTYTNGHSEKIIGDFFAARPGVRDRVVLSTKFFATLHPDVPAWVAAQAQTIAHFRGWAHCRRYRPISPSTSTQTAVESPDSRWRTLDRLIAPEIWLTGGAPRGARVRAPRSD